MHKLSGQDTVLWVCQTTELTFLDANMEKQGNGTTSFPKPGSISGTITYYITDLPTYSSLAPCATRAVSEVVQQLSYSLCQSAPDALASCACYKNQNSAAISKQLVSSVNYECSSTASADVTSALGVFDFYCNAAGGKVVASGVTASGMRNFLLSGQSTCSFWVYGKVWFHQLTISQ